MTERDRSYASLALNNLLRASIIQQTYANHEPISHFRVPLSRSFKK